MSNKVEERTEKIIEKIIQDQPEIELVDVEYVKERDWYLRVFIDKKGGVDLEDCQKFSECLGSILDNESIISGSYILEVSSPGLDRVLKKERDFVRENGKEVDISFYAPVDGKKSLTGTLKGYDGKFIKLDKMEPIAMEKVAQVRLHVNF